MEVAGDRMGGRDVLQTVLHADTDMIRVTLDEIDRDAFQGAVDALMGAKRIYILGVRSSSALASFLGFYFNLLFENVTLVHTNSVSEIFEQVLRVGPGDVLFGISFPRYSKRTLSAMKYARDRGARVIALTDSQLSPLARVADHVLLARSDMASFVDSLVAPLSVILSLIHISMSKSHNMPGWRVGMLATNAQFVQWILKIKSNIDSGTFRPMQLAAAQAYNNSVEWHEEANVNVYSLSLIHIYQ